MYYLVMILHLLIAFVLCLVVLLQSSKGDGLAGAFGGGGAGQAVFGARGVTTILHKLTIYLAISFMVTSLFLVFLTMNRTGGSGGGLSQEAGARIPVSGQGQTTIPVGEDAVLPADLLPPADDAATTDEGEGAAAGGEQQEEGSGSGGEADSGGGQ